MLGVADGEAERLGALLGCPLGDALKLGWLLGIEEGDAPPAPITGNAYDANLEAMPSDWDSAISAFEASDLARSIFDPLFIQSFIGTKRQEQRITADLDAKERTHMYFERV